MPTLKYFGGFRELASLVAPQTKSKRGPVNWSGTGNHNGLFGMLLRQRSSSRRAHGTRKTLLPCLGSLTCLRILLLMLDLRRSLSLLACHRKLFSVPYEMI